MSLVGELSLLLAFVSSGYASFAAMAGRRYGNARITASAAVAAAASFCALSVVMVILGWCWCRTTFALPTWRPTPVAGFLGTMRFRPCG